jgi:hypothetical protein
MRLGIYHVCILRLNLATTPAGNLQSGTKMTMRPDKNVPAPLRFLVPSIADLLFLILLYAMTCGVLAPKLLGDADIGWHIRNGELMLHTHTITRTDPFSATMFGKLWYSWEWLYDVAAGRAHEWAGLNGVVLFTAILIAFTFALLFRMGLKRGGDVVASSLLLIIAFGASAIHLFSRPHTVSWLFTIIWFQILDSNEALQFSNETNSPTKNKDKSLYWLPVIALFWANMHGGFLVGFVLLGIYFVSGVIQFFFRARQREQILGWLQQLGTVSVVSFLATFVNPYGPKLYLHIYGYLSDRWLMDHIDEFQSPNFHGLSQQCFILLLLITVAGLAWTRQRPRISQVLVILFAVHSGFYAARNLPVSCMLLVLIVVPLIAKFSEEGSAPDGKAQSGFPGRLRSFNQRMRAQELQLRGHLWPWAAAAVLFFACAHGGQLHSRQIMNARFDPTRFPVEAADWVAAKNISGPIFSPDAWGGYLIYRFSPEQKVFVDDRHDLYGTDFLKNYVKVIQVSPDWKKVLDQQKLKQVLVPKDSSLANILRETPQWKEVYKDRTAAYFLRD